MALVLIEEVLMGLEQAKDSLEQSVVTLATLTEDLTPDLVEPWKEKIETALLRPLEKRAAMLDTLLGPRLEYVSEPVTRRLCVTLSM